MRWYNKLKLVFRIYTRRVGVTLLLFGMSYIAFYMTDRVLTKYISDRYDIWQVEKSFSDNPDDSGFIYFIDKEQNQDISYKVCEYMKQLQDVEASGYFINTSIIVGDESNNEYIGGFIIEKDIIDIGNLKLDAELKDKISLLKNDEKVTLLGNSLRGDFNKGETLEVYEGDTTKRIQIDGFLKRDARWVHEDRLFGASYGAQDKYVLNDNAVVIIGSLNEALDSVVYSDIVQNICFKCKEGMFEVVSENIKQFCYKEGISISIINYGDEIKEQYLKSNILDDDNTFVAAVMIMVLAIIAISISNIVNCLMSKIQYGIMMSNGVSQNEIMWILVVQNMIVLILAGLGAWCVRIRMIFSTFFPRSIIEGTGRYFQGEYIAHTYYMPLILITVIAVIMVVSNIIPYIIIRQISITDMIEGSEL